MADAEALLAVDVQEGFINPFTPHIPERITALIAREAYDPVLFTRFINTDDGPYRRFIGWDACADEPETNLTSGLAALAAPERTFTKPGYAGLPDKLKEYLRDQGEPFVLVDCCASTAGLQAHLAGLAVLARNIGADHLRDAGLSDGHLAAPLPDDA